MRQETTAPCKGGEDCRSLLHLCRLMERSHDPERVRAFVKDPVYYCRRCGRAAHEPQSLCRPVLL